MVKYVKVKGLDGGICWMLVFDGQKDKWSETMQERILANVVGKIHNPDRKDFSARLAFVANSQLT